MSMSYVTLGLYVCIRICIKRGDSLAKTNNAKKKSGEGGGGQKAGKKRGMMWGARTIRHTLTEAEITKSPHFWS
jgi:hypothetical protein